MCVDNKIDKYDELRNVYDDCVLDLQRFRTAHIALVADYIIAQQKTSGDRGLEGSAGGKGTGGTDLMKFLKPIRDDCRKTLMVIGFSAIIHITENVNIVNE